MGRIPRSDLLYNGSFAHVFSRSIYQQKVFKKQEDFNRFRDLLKEAKKEGKFKTYHYCLMHTHFHMVVEIEDVNQFSTALKELKRQYTYWHNEQYKQRGPLWRDRFKSMLIEDERYLNACGAYIENNPVKAGLVQSSEQWAFSSARHYLLNQRDELIDPYDHNVEINDFDLNDDRFFTKGNSIGSGLFKLLLKDIVG